MKNFSFVFAVIGIPMAIVSCKKGLDNHEAPKQLCQADPQEIVFTAGGPGLDISTKSVTEINQMTGFYVMTTTGSAGSETLVWSQLVQGSGQPGALYESGKYWPSTDPHYHFYASVSEITFAAAGPTVTVNGNADIICAYLETPEYNEQNALTFEHIMGRVGTFTLNTTASGYTLSNVQVKLSNGIKRGTYNIRTGEWSGKSSAEKVTMTTGENDFLLLPGDYTLTVTFTMTKGDYTATFTKSAALSLEAGKITNITANIVDDPAVRIKFTYTTTPWTSKSVTLTVE